MSDNGNGKTPDITANNGQKLQTLRPDPLHGLVKFDIALQTLRTDLDSIALEKQIREALGDALQAMPENTRWNIGELATFWVCTRNIVVSLAPDAPGWLEDLHELWAARKDLTPLQLWQRRLDIPNDVIMAWRRAFNAAQVLFEVDPAELPEAALTPDQKAEAAQPDSPLPAPAKPSRGK